MANQISYGSIEQFGDFYSKDVYVNEKYIGFVELLPDEIVFWELSSYRGEGNFVAGHVGTYDDGVDYSSFDDLEDDLKFAKQGEKNESTIEE